MSESISSIGIVGAGIAGLAAAIALLRDGHNVKVFEKSEQIREVGAGLQLSPNATSILHSWGVLESVLSVGCLPTGLHISNWASGACIASFPQNRKQGSFPYVHIHRADLQNILLNEVKRLDERCVCINTEIENVTQHDQSVSIQLGEREETFDWLIGADGIHSLVQASCLDKLSAPEFTGNVAWRGLIPVHLLHSKPETKTHLAMGPGGHVVFYYVRGGALLNYVAVQEREGWTNESWTEKANVDTLLQDFKGWNPEILKYLSLSDPDSCFRWALHDRRPFDSWCKGRCIIIGDAAHPMLPFLAQGAAMGIEDASALAYCFKNYSASRVGDQFFTLRSQRTARVQGEARKNMKVFHQKNPLIQTVRDNGLKMLSKLYPDFMNRKLSWLYQYRL